MVDWNTGAPNARFRVLELLKNNFGPGDRIVEGRSASPYVYALPYITIAGEHKVLLVNKRDRDIEIEMPQLVKQARVVNRETGSSEPKTEAPGAKTIRLRGLEVAVLTLE